MTKFFCGSDLTCQQLGHFGKRARGAHNEAKEMIFSNYSNSSTIVVAQWGYNWTYIYIIILYIYIYMYNMYIYITYISTYI